MAERVQSGTLTADEVLEVSIVRHAGKLTIVNRSFPEETIWARVDGVDPTVAGEDCFPVTDVRTFDLATVATDTAKVKLIANAALDYTVEGTSN